MAEEVESNSNLRNTRLVTMKRAEIAFSSFLSSEVSVELTLELLEPLLRFQPSTLLLQILVTYFSGLETDELTPRSLSLARVPACPRGSRVGLLGVRLRSCALVRRRDRTRRRLRVYTIVGGRWFGGYLRWAVHDGQEKSTCALGEKVIGND